MRFAAAASCTYHGQWYRRCLLATRDEVWWGIPLVLQGLQRSCACTRDMQAGTVQLRADARSEGELVALHNSNRLTHSREHVQTCGVLRPVCAVEQAEEAVQGPKLLLLGGVGQHIKLSPPCSAHSAP
jgi:hypothetical protein